MEKNKKIAKMMYAYISEKYNQIIIAPYYINSDGIYYGQEECFCFDKGIENEEFGKEIIKALNNFECKDKNLVNATLAGWPAFKYSKLKTEKLFKEDYKQISISSVNEYNLVLRIECPINKSDFNVSSVISFQAKKYEIGKTVKDIYEMSLKINNFDKPIDGKQFIEALLYEEDTSIIVSGLKKIKDPKMLFMFASEYNWDDGFSIPFEILKNSCCDMSTALLLFELSGGYEYLCIDGGIGEISNSSNEQANFIKDAYNRIAKNDFTTGQTEYKPEAAKSKVQVYKLKKVNPEVPEIFIDGIKLL